MPDLPRYSSGFRARLADELEALAPYECPRDAAPPPGCSALSVWARDHARLRDQVRAARP